METILCSIDISQIRKEYLQIKRKYITKKCVIDKNCINIRVAGKHTKC